MYFLTFIGIQLKHSYSNFYRMKISIVTFINIYLNRKCPQKVMSGEPKGASHLNHLITCIIIKERRPVYM